MCLVLVTIVAVLGETNCALGMVFRDGIATYRAHVPPAVEALMCHSASATKRAEGTATASLRHWVKFEYFTMNPKNVTVVW